MKGKVRIRYIGSLAPNLPGGVESLIALATSPSLRICGLLIYRVELKAYYRKFGKEPPEYQLLIYRVELKGKNRVRAYLENRSAPNLPGGVESICLFSAIAVRFWSS